MSYMPVRGGTRGGKDLFQWDDVKTDKHRENYLGHSVMAPVGRWQKGKDLSWYSKKSKVLGQKEVLRAEIAAVKRAEEEAMAAALGLKPKTLSTGNVSKQELAEVCRRQSVDEKEEEGQEERMTGLGFMRWSHRHSNQAAATGAAMFESRPVHEVESGQPASHPPPPPSSATTAPPARQRQQEERVWVDKLPAEGSTTHRSKNKDKKKKKRNKEKSRKKHKKDRSRKPQSSSSDAEEESSRQQRKRRDSGSCTSDDNDRKQRKKRHVVPRSSDSEEDRRRRRRRDRQHRERRKSESESEEEENDRKWKKTRDRDKTRTTRRRHDSSSD